MIMDTNFLTALAEGDALAVGTLDRRPAWVPAIVIGEYRAGLAQSAQRAQRTQWLDEGFESDDVILEVTRHTARHYADIWNELRAIGRPIPQNDIWIAALAREHKMPIVSKDAHFDAVPGLKRLGW